MGAIHREFNKEKRWVNWRYVRVEEKLTKVPFGKNGAGAKSNDPSTWMTLKEAQAISENVGLMATLDKKTLLVDLDNCIEKGEVVGTNRDAILDFIEASKTYTELSPSGKGLHFFFRLTAPLSLTANKHTASATEKIECYTSGRFFTVTGTSYGEEQEVRTTTPQNAKKLLALLGYPWKDDDSEETGDRPSANSSLSLPNEEILSKMFASKNGSAICALYNGDTSAYDGDDSSADMALLNHLAFWTGKNAQQMQDIWMASPLGARKKTQSRPDYRTRSIASAIKLCKEVYDPTPTPAVEDTWTPQGEAKLDLMTHLVGKKIVIDNSTENIMRVLSGHKNFRGRFRYDEFKRTYEIHDPRRGWRQFEDVDAISIQCEIQRTFPPFQMISKTMVLDAIIEVMHQNRYDSAVSYLKGLKWDGVPRLGTWLKHTYGAEDNEYHRAVGSNWLKGLVKRLVEPGCKFDYVLVLEGPQGTKKSTSLYILGGGWHVESTMTTENKDFYMQMAGKAIVEFSEGETLSRTEVKRLKAIITMQNDKYRPPYERASKDFPRRCVFAMTTNETEYLKDDTGNRRWLPVTLKLEEANIEWLKNNRDQLLAEAYARVQAGETVYELPKEATLEAQAARKIKDPNTDLVVDWYWRELSKDEREKGITVTQVYKVISGGFLHKPMTKFDEMNTASILRDGLKLEKKQVMLNGVRLTRWYATTPEPDNLTPLSIMESLENF